MKVYVAQRNTTLAELKERVEQCHDVGVSGILASDHLFVPRPEQRAQGRLPHEPITLLTTIATLSDRLEVGTIVSNVGFLHPALVLRQFAQMAVLFGGERVLAGLGAGWSREEFEAIGLRMPPHAERVDRLEEAAHLARQMFDTGVGDLEGQHVVARDLPLAPRPETPPRLLLGGGSDRLLGIAGRYADILDLNGSSRRSPVAGKNLAQADLQRRLRTTVADLEDSVRRVRMVSREAGRNERAVSMTLLINELVVCADGEVEERQRAIAEAAGLSDQPLDDCPYVMVGSAERIADLLAERQQRLQIDGLILTNNIDPRPLCEQILPRLSS